MREHALKLSLFISLFYLGHPGMLLATTLFQPFPETPVYPRYIADPLRPTSNFQYMYFDKTSIYDTSNNRFDIKLGGNFLLGEWKHQDSTFPVYQLVLDGGFHGQFDIKYNQDNIGWDGLYGLRLLYRANDRLAFNVGSKHISSHVGDEYQERTGRTRINYTREEFLMGLAWSYDQNTDIYFELAHAYDLRNKAVQKPRRAQAGFQYQVPGVLWNRRFGWYTALDLTAFEENSWHRNLTLQTGIYTSRGNSTWRIGVELYDGRAQIGEFFQDNERYISIGIWYDL